MMADSMHILGWKAEGFRCPDHEIDCCDSKGNPSSISLIQMPNGTGKTTTLLLLRAALSGNAQQWTTEEIREIKKRNDLIKSGAFTLRLLLNRQLMTIIMDFDFENAKVSYKTTGASGQDEGFHPPRAFDKFMSPDFVNYYAFDGELAQNLLERTHTHAIRVIERLFLFSLLDYIGTRISDYWEAQTRNVTAKDEKGRTQRLHTATRLKVKLNRLEEAKEKLDERRIKIEIDLEQKNKQYKLAIDSIQGQSSSLEQKKSSLLECEEQIKIWVKEVLHSTADPHALSATFATNIKNFKDSLDRVKLPESAAREFFEELAEEDNCVCGRPIDESIRTTIKERAAQYLGSEEFSLLNSMKTAIGEAVSPPLEEPELQLREKVDRLTSWVRARETVVNEINELEIEAEHQDPKIAEAKKDIELLNEELTKVDGQLSSFQDGRDRDEDTTDIGILRTKFEQALLKLAEITNTLELRNKKDLLTKIINNAADAARHAVINEICNQTNSRIVELMPYNNIRLDTIDRCLILKGQRGGSAGEQLSIAYAFLATLFNSSDQHLPFIVDSPAGAIDLAIRPKIAELVPNLSSQFIAFTISTEREGFVPRLESASGHSVQYITLFRKGLTDIEELAKKTESWSETNDGLIVEDEQFFNTFQVETEEE